MNLKYLPCWCYLFIYFRIQTLYIRVLFYPKYNYIKFWLISLELFQISIHLANRGFRVFAGLKDLGASGFSDDTTSAKVIRAWQKYRESIQGPGILIPLPLDVSREDLLHEAVDIIRAHLPAGEDGKKLCIFSWIY